MNCKKCGYPLNGATVCPKCGTSIGYVVRDPVGFNLASDTNHKNGYVQNNPSSGYVQINNPAGFGFSNISEPSDGAFNKSYSSEQTSFNNSLESVNNNVLSNSESKIKKSHSNLRGFKPLHKIAEEEIYETGAPTLVNFGTSSSGEDSLLARAGTMSKDMLLEQINDNQNDKRTNKRKAFMNGLSMDLPDDKKTTRNWLIAAGVIIVVIIIGVYVLPLFTDIGYSKYEDDSFIIKYEKDWVLQVDEKTKKTTFFYKNTNYKVILNAISTFSEMNFQVKSEADKKVLYKAFYDSWKNVSGGKLTGGFGTFTNLDSDDEIYTKIDYELDNNQGVGSFYVVICEKYDLVISFMTYCTVADQKVFEEHVLDFIKGINYIGPTALEKEREAYKSFEAGEVKPYQTGNLINYVIPNSWTFDSQRTAAVGNQYNIFQFKDKYSLLEIKAYAGKYTYEGMKESAISSFGAIKAESKKTIKGKVWYVLNTPDYSSGGYSYHNELYFTMSTNNNYIYFVQAYVYNETDKDSVKRKYFDDSIKYILENMTLINVDK